MFSFLFLFRLQAFAGVTVAFPAHNVISGTKFWTAIFPAINVVRATPTACALKRENAENQRVPTVACAVRVSAVQG